MSRKRLFSGIALAVVLAACGESGRDPLAPDFGPSLDGGGPVVGGNRTDSTTTTTTVESDTTSRGGGPVVGGN